MTINELRRVMLASPFRAFSLRMADGREYPVPHRDFLWIHPAGRTAVVATLDDDAFEIINLLLVASLHFGNGTQRRNGHPKRRGR
jgi:hypothetical protein